MPPRKDNLTKIELLTYLFIFAHIKHYGCSPMYKEIATYFGISESNARHRVDRLIWKGYIDWEYRRQRGLTINDGRRKASVREI